MQPFPSAARAPAVPNKPVGDGAEVINGEIVMWLDGRRAPVSPSTAWAEWLRLFAALHAGRTVVFPLDGIGSGLADLERRSPTTWAHLQQRINELKSAGEA